MSNAACQSGLRTNNSGLFVVSPSASIDWLPDAIANTVWPGVWPGAAIDVMPGATSLFGSNFSTFAAMSPKMRRTFSHAGRAPSGCFAMLASSIHQAHSAAGTLTSAFGNTIAPSLVLSR